MVCLWLSLFFSSSFRACTPAMRRSSSWKRWLVQSECRSIHELWIIQQWRGNHKRRRQKDCSVRQKWTAVEDGRDSHTERLHHRIICLISVSYQLSPAVGESQNSQNAMLPAQSRVHQLRYRGNFSCVWWASRDDASVWSIEVKCQPASLYSVHWCQRLETD